MKVSRSLLGAAALAFGSSAAFLSGATVEMPRHSGTASGVFATTPNAGNYVYVMTQYGFARVDVSDPANPTDPKLAQVGLKLVGGINNGGAVGMDCDCWQGGSTIDVAESPDGNSRMVSDWVASGQGLNAEVATGTPGSVGFGQQIDVDSVPLGSRVAAIYLSSGRYIGYFPYLSGAGGGIARADVTSPTGNPSRNNGILAVPTLGWGNGKSVLLKAGLIGGKYLLVGATNTDKKIRIAEIDPTTGVPIEKSTASSAAGNVAALALATVEGRTFVFAAENTAGLRIYEYAGGELQAPITLPGQYNDVLLRGGTLPVLFVHSIVSFAGRETYVEAWDTNWITRGNGNPALARRGARQRHFGAAENYLGGFEARVVGSTGYLYRITPYGGVEAVFESKSFDLSSLTIDPNSAPIANSTAINLSAAARQGVERTINYHGDKWDVRDASASAPGPPANGLSLISWDWNFAGSFAADTGWAAVPYGANSNVSPAYFPCDPAAGGNVETGAGCWASLGSPAAAGTYRYALQTVNGVGPSLPAPSSSTAVAAPQALIAGLDTSVNPPVLKVLTGQGQADARGSQGNIADATFAWTFNPGAVAAAGQLVAVPAGATPATSFSLAITYPGGYRATTTGNIQQVDLVPEFTPTQGAILVGGSLTISNAMQKSTSTTLNSAEYSWDNGPFVALPASFNPVGGTASVPAPALGNHTLRVKFNYMRPGTSPTSATVSHGPFNVSNTLIVSLTGPTSGRTGTSNTFTAAVQGGSGSPTFSWCWEACNVFPQFDVGPATNSHVYNSAGTKTVVVQVTDSGISATATAAIVITGGAQPLVLTLTAPSTGQLNVPVNLTASARGGTQPYSYAWCWEACSVGGTFSAGPASNSHTYTTTGIRSVAVRVTDGANRTQTRTASISITEGGGGGGGNLAVSVSGPSAGQVNQTLSFTANATGGTSPYSYAWCWDGCNLGGSFASGSATATHAYPSAGTRFLVARVTDGTNATALASFSVVIGGSGRPAPASGFSVAGAALNPSNNTWVTEAGRGISMTADEANASAWAWDFGDGTTGSGRSVTKSFAAEGSYTVGLTVTGDDTNTGGTSTSTKKFAVGAPLFSAVAVPDAAYIVTSDGAWKTDVSVTNRGTTDLEITPLFVSYETLAGGGPVIDVTSLGFSGATKYLIAPGGSWSQADAVGFLGGAGKGNLFFQTEGGETPEIAARVYFSPNDPELGAYGNAVPAFQIGAFGQVGVQSIRAVNPQTILGLKSDEKQRFKLKLYNSSSALNGFRLRAFDETGAPVPVKDNAGNDVESLDVAVGAYSAAEFSDERLGLIDPARGYVLKAEPITVGAMLLATASVLDRLTNDQVQVADSDTRPVPEDGIVTTWVPGVSRLDSTGHWRTSVSILNSGDAPRSVLVEYFYNRTQVAQTVLAMLSGQLVTYGDISELFPNVPEIATATETSGLLRVTYTADADTAIRPIYVSARSYDDRSETSGGTAGTALASYAAGDAIGFGDAPIVIPGAEQNERFRTNVGLFALDPDLTIVKVTAIDKDGNVVGSVDGVPLNNPDPNALSGPWSQFPITAIAGLPPEPVSLRIEVLQGGRVGAYAINIDQKSLDTTFIKGTP